MTTPNPAEDFPVGGVIAFAGLTSSDDLKTQGWLICDGRELAIAAYPDLYAALGTCNGGDGSTYFNLPDLRGRFLRGIDRTGTTDPDVLQRTAPAPGAAFGASPGSVQGGATGMPKNKFGVSVPHNPGGNLTAVNQPPYDNYFLSSPAPPLPFPTMTGGDGETRPVNAYVHYIIKFKPGVNIPIAAVMSFGGTRQYPPEGAGVGHDVDPFSNWTVCGGGLI